LMERHQSADGCPSSVWPENDISLIVWDEKETNAAIESKPMQTQMVFS
jgi:hypothetical protein